MSGRRFRYLFLITSLSVAVLCIAPVDSRNSQTGQRRFPDPPASAQGDADKKEPQGIDPQFSRKARLAQNEKEFREGIEHLYELASELRDEVQKTPPSGVLSVSMYKRTEEIEKLAKRMKNKAKGE